MGIYLSLTCGSRFSRIQPRQMQEIASCCKRRNTEVYRSEHNYFSLIMVCFFYKKINVARSMNYFSIKEATEAKSSEDVW